MSWGDRPPGPVVLEPQDSPDHPLAPWFAHWRADRAAARDRSPTGARTRAVVTIVHNEPVFLPLWLGYYGRFFAPEDRYVLDNQSTDGSTRGGGFVRVPAERARVDHTWMARRLEELQHELLEQYDVVVVTDVDELVAPVPEWGDLGEYLDHFSEEWVNCLGYEILHRPDEPPIDLHRPLLDQRRWWYPNDGYNKAAVATVPMRWRPGLHGRADFQTRPDPDLRMIHLHRLDRDLCRERHRTRSRKPWATSDERQSWAIHNRIVDGEEFDRWFYGDSAFAHIPIKLEEVHPSWRGVL